MFDPTDHHLSVNAVSLGASLAEVEACRSEEELRDLVLEYLAERSRRAVKQRELAL